MKEIWRDIVNYEGLYQVSNLGRVKSLERKVKKRDGYRTVPERILRPYKQADDYLQVALCKDGKVKTCSIHRLVAQTFLPNPLSLPEVNHINEDKEDNRVSNLEWCTSQYNVEYSQAKPVLQYSLSGQLIREWSSGMEAQRQGGFNNRGISECCSGKRNTHKGFYWKHKNERTNI